ncbi:hypothetical protein E2I00_002050, partial [Balaenoptera physalus]
GVHDSPGIGTRGIYYPICVDNLKDPVTINCGHSFCCSCINMTWKDLEHQEQTQLSHLTEIANLLQIRRSMWKGQEENSVCEKHNQFLTLVCGKNLEVLCTQCCFSIQHQKHYNCPIMKAASHHRKILECTVEPLKSDMEQVEKPANQLNVRNQVKCRREEINSECEQFRLFLQNQQEDILRQMEDEEMDILTKLYENFVTFTGHASILKHLLREVGESCHDVRTTTLRMWLDYPCKLVCSFCSPIDSG